MFMLFDNLGRLFSRLFSFVFARQPPCLFQHSTKGGRGYINSALLANTLVSNRRVPFHDLKNISLVIFCV